MTAEFGHPCLGGGMQRMPGWQGMWEMGDLAVAVILETVPRCQVSE